MSKVGATTPVRAQRAEFQEVSRVVPDTARWLSDARLYNIKLLASDAPLGIDSPAHGTRTRALRMVRHDAYRSNSCVGRGSTPRRKARS